jgi:hypothetical protein
VISFFMTALGLAPTAEKHLTDVQRRLCPLLPSALALPPVLPLFPGTAPPSAADIAALRAQARPPFTFAGYLVREGVLCAAPSVDISLRGDAQGGLQSGARERCGFFPPRLPGFYLAVGEDARAPGELPALPAFTVKTLRLLVIKLRLGAGSPPLRKGPARAWWKAVQWEIVSEAWIKLRADPERPVPS